MTGVATALDASRAFAPSLARAGSSRRDDAALPRASRARARARRVAVAVRASSRREEDDGRSSADDDATPPHAAPRPTSRAAAASAAKLAPRDVTTQLGLELSSLMKTDPVLFERALRDQLRALASELLHPSFPGGRSGALRPHVHGASASGEASSSASADASAARSLRAGWRALPSRSAGGRRHSFSSRSRGSRASGRGAPPRSSSSNAEYDRMEGITQSVTPNGETASPDEEQTLADETLMRELSLAVADGAKTQRRLEIQDVMYLSIAHAFNAVGVPLAPDASHYRGRGLRASPDPRRHREKVRRLLREILPDGAEAPLEDFVREILVVADDPRASGRVGAAGLPALTLASVYGASARFGYFLSVASERLALERALGGDGDGEDSEDLEDSKKRYSNGAGAHGSSGSSSSASAADAGDAVDSSTLWDAPECGPIGDWVSDDDEECAVQESAFFERRRHLAVAAGKTRERSTETESVWGDSSVIAADQAVGFEKHLIEEALAEQSAEEREEAGRVPLQMFVEAMTPALRASSARLAATESVDVLALHVDALFGPADVLSARLAAALDAELSPPDARRSRSPDARMRAVQRAAMNGDIDIVRMPLDALRYLVVEAAAFGAALRDAEAEADGFELVTRRDAEDHVGGGGGERYLDAWLDGDRPGWV